MCDLRTTPFSYLCLISIVCISLSWCIIAENSPLSGHEKTKESRLNLKFSISKKG